MSRGTDTSADSADDSESRPTTWRSRLGWGARAERDDARSERDALREELARAHEERDALRDELSRERADGRRAEIERDASLLRATNAVGKEVSELHRLEKATSRQVRLLHRELMTDIQALQQLLTRYSPEARLPPVGGWALSPSGLLALVDAIETKGATMVVECGSGTSTLWIGYALKRLGRGRVVSLDHLPEYAGKTRAVVAAHGLDDFVDVRLAPLSLRQTPRGAFPWYSFDPADLSDPIDALVVDGPPQSTGHHARYPALPLLADSLAAGAIIVADDADRPDETEMLEFWLEEEPRLRRTESVGFGIEVLTFGD
ncbi:class I SAM-dependent methyltransferase [Microbacterium sp. RD1]|uniref:class I SAM-dependent methyltransferase n=1 Tax=Microbacterium sp. RD1 TaxID=3457313 RepID=UPI003FA58A25